MIPWHLILAERELQLQELREKANRIKRSTGTLQTTLDAYPAIKSFIAEKFPDLDLSPVAIFITTYAAMKRVSFEHMGGCYIDSLKTIFVMDNNSLNHHDKTKGKFMSDLLRMMAAKLDVEDILVHEIMHATSSALGRATRGFSNAEEEFVYTYCTEFYKRKGMSDQEMIDKHFLTFCLNDVMSSKDEMAKIFETLKITHHLRYVPWLKQYSKYELEKFMDTHAEFLVPAVIAAAKTKARTMIDCYHKYGCRGAPLTVDVYDTGMRFRSINYGVEDDN